MIIIGIDAIVASGLCGMPRSHIEATLAVAREDNTYVGVRPVSKFARTILEAGYPTKPFVVKNKSTKIGAAAGLIVIDPRYSQTPDDQYLAYRDKLNQSMQADKDLRVIPFILSAARIKELPTLLGANIDSGGIEITEIKDKKDSLIRYRLMWKKAGKSVSVIAKQTDENSQHFLVEDEVTREPLRVLGKVVLPVKPKHESAAASAATVISPAGVASSELLDAHPVATRAAIDPDEIALPITADYDLLVAGVQHNDYDPKLDATPFRVAPAGKVGTLSDPKRELRRTGSFIIQKGPEAEHPTGGNWNERTMKLVARLNAKIQELDPNRGVNKGKNLDLYHHNSEMLNPFASDDLNEHFPSLFTLPIKMDVSSLRGVSATTSPIMEDVLLLENIDDLREVVELIRAHGYMVPTHFKYKDVLPGVVQKAGPEVNRGILKRTTSSLGREMAERSQSLYSSRSSTPDSSSQGSSSLLRSLQGSSSSLLPSLSASTGGFPSLSINLTGATSRDASLGALPGVPASPLTPRANMGLRDPSQPRTPRGGVLQGPSSRPVSGALAKQASARNLINRSGSAYGLVQRSSSSSISQSTIAAAVALAIDNLPDTVIKNDEQSTKPVKMSDRSPQSTRSETSASDNASPLRSDSMAASNDTSPVRSSSDSADPTAPAFERTRMKPSSDGIFALPAGLSRSPGMANLLAAAPISVTPRSPTKAATVLQDELAKAAEGVKAANPNDKDEKILKRDSGDSGKAGASKLPTPPHSPKKKGK